jgi:hypothetical protein
MSDPDEEHGREPQDEDDIILRKPKNRQSSAKRIRRGIEG